MKLLIATFNPGKQAEFKRILTQLDTNLNLVFPQDFGLKDDLKETGKTFAQNSRLKTDYYFKQTQIPTIADDGGLEISVLHGEPGVKSRRWLGRRATDQELINYALKKLKSHKTSQRQAFLTTVVTFYNGKRHWQEKRSISGHIAKKARKTRSPGYPFRDLLIIDRFKKYYADLSESEHQQVNHRQKALKALWQKTNEFRP